MLPEAELKTDDYARKLGIKEFIWTKKKYLETKTPEDLLKRKLQGVREVKLSTFQGKVYSFGIFFDVPLWKTTKEYSDFLKETLRLSVYQDKFNGDEYINYDCREINLTASVSEKDAVFSLEDPRRQNTIEARRIRLRIPQPSFDVLELPSKQN